MVQISGYMHHSPIIPDFIVGQVEDREVDEALQILNLRDLVVVQFQLLKFRVADYVRDKLESNPHKN